MGTTVVSVVSQITGNISLGVGMDRSALPGGADPLPPGVQDSVLTGSFRNAKKSPCVLHGDFYYALVPGQPRETLGLLTNDVSRHILNKVNYVQEASTWNGLT